VAKGTNAIPDWHTSLPSLGCRLFPTIPVKWVLGVLPPLLPTSPHKDNLVTGNQRDKDFLMLDPRD